MNRTLPQDWRTQNRALRRVYAKYMTWLERLGYFVVVLVIGGFVYAFNYSVDETVSADKVKLELASRPIKMEEAVSVAKMLVPTRAEVKAGQDLFTFYGSGPARRPLVFRATSDGIFVAAERPGGQFKAGEEIGRVYDPSTIVCKASLAGASVSRASDKEEVRVSNIVVEPTSGVTYRQATSQGPIVSSQVFDDSLVKAATEVLKGYDLKLRDDRPFSASDVTDVTVESLGGTATAGLASDPDPGLTCKAVVVSAQDKAVVQVADLPAAARDKLDSAVKDTFTKNGLAAPDHLRYVLKLKAGQPDGSAPSLPATALNRTYDIEANLVDPPSTLLQAVRRATLAGKSVTAKVELKTGSRPLATILLKKS